MAQLKVREYLTIRPTSYVKAGGGLSAYYIGTIKGINRMGGAVQTLGKHLEQVNKLYQFRNEFLIQSQAERIKLEQKGLLLDEKEEKAAEDKNKKWWRRFLDQKNEDESEKAAKKPESKIDKSAAVIKKAVSPLKKFLSIFAPLFETFIRFTLVTGVLNWITDQKTSELAKVIKNVITVFGFVRKLVGFGVGSLLDGLSNLFGGFDKIKQGNIVGAFQGLLGVGQFLAGVALIKGAQYVMMPWKLIQDVGWVIKLFTEWGKINGEAEGAAANKDIAGYVDKNGNTISKEDFEKAKKSAARNDSKRAKQKGKGWSYSGGQDAISDRYRAQYNKRNKNFFQRTGQRARIGVNRATRGVRGQFKAAGNWMQANPAKANGIFSVVGGLTRAAGGLMSGENAGQAVGAGLGQATGGIAGFALGNMLLPGIGGIIGSALGSFLGEWVGTKLGPIIDPIMKPLGNAFKLGFDIIGIAIGPILNDFGEAFSAVFDALGEILKFGLWLGQAAFSIINFAWENSLFKKAIDGIVWVWQNKDNIAGAVRDVLVQGAKGTLDALTFNVFDFDKQNKKFAGGKVPLMAQGGLLQTDSPEVMGLKVAGTALISTIEGALSSMGVAGQFTQMAMSSDLNRLKGTFGMTFAAPFSGSRIATQVTKPNSLRGQGTAEQSGSSNGKLEQIVGTSEVKFLTTQPEQFTAMNDKSMRGLLADIYNGLVSLKVIGGDTMVTPTGDPGNTPMPTGDATDLVTGAKIFMQLGLSPLAASYMSGNVQQESGWKGQRTPWVLNDGAGLNKGLISWNRGRLKSGEAFLGKPIEKATNAEQARWIVEEMKRSYKDSWAILSNPKATKEQLKQAIYWYIGWGHEGARWKYGEHALNALSKEGIKTAASGGLILMDKGGSLKDPESEVPSWYAVKETKNARRNKKAKGAKAFAQGGLLSLGGSSAPGGDRRLSSTSSFSDTHLHHNEPDGSPHNRALMGYGFGSPRDYVVTRGPQSMDRGTPIVAGAAGKVKVVGGDMNIVELYDNSGRKLARFLHNEKIVVKDGQTVGPNTVIATQGSAGGNWPVHVHMEGSPAFQTNWIKATLGNTNLADIQGQDGMSSSPSTTTGGSKTSLLGGSGETKDPLEAAGIGLEEALKKWAAAFGGGPQLTQATPGDLKSMQPDKAVAKPSAAPSSTSTSTAVQKASEQHTTREASKATAAVVPIPITQTVVQSSGQTQPVVMNKAQPSAMISK
jgi:murein DD-endopeptidase MepM/ murein hydrolase activator NlpD